ncbi:MAG: DNA polymerase III subunit alpha [bacterium]
MVSFTPLICHSHFSLLWGTASPDALCRRAREAGVSALGLTDREGLYGALPFWEAARQTGVRPILGAHVPAGRAPAFLLVAGPRGYRRLCRILTRHHQENGFSLFEALLQDRRELVVLSPDTAFLEALARESGAARDLGVALYPYGPQRERIRFSLQSGIRLVATPPVYFLDPEDHPLHKLLRAIFLCTKLDRIPSHETAPDWAWFQDPERWESRYLHCPEALRGMQHVAEACGMDEPPWGPWVFPPYEGLSESTAFERLREKCREGVLNRYGGFSQAIEDRLAHELELIRSKGFATYFLVVQDIVLRFPITCGRGSAAASLVSYCLGITHVDPIRHDLFFERFLNPGRTDPPDIDVDFPWDERDAVLSYVLEKYGPERCAMVANHVGFGARAAIRETAKVYGVPESEIQGKLRHLRLFWDPKYAREMAGPKEVDLGGCSKMPRCKAREVPRNEAYISVRRSDPGLRRGRLPAPMHRAERRRWAFWDSLQDPWPEILKWADRLEGMPRHLSVHCGGVIVTPDPLPERVPVEMAAKGVPVIQWEKDGTEDAGLVKIDLLGNRSLAVIRDTLARLRKTRGIDISYSRLNPLDDPETMAMLARGESVGVFYMESPSMRQLLRKTGRGDFEHLVVQSSIIRPAANDYIREYVRRDRGGAYEPLHPILGPILEETHGILCYQEDVSKTAMALAGFDAVQADELRKILSKKHKQRQLADTKGRFFEGARARGVPEPTIEEIWRMILSFQGYSFCKPHSASYALVSCKACYLKAHYPAEFMAAVLSNQGGYYSTQAYLSEARRMGLDLLLPDINESDLPYAGSGRAVRVGLMQLKGVHRNSLEALMDERESGGPFLSMEDLFRRVDIDPSDVRILIKAGCLDSVARGRTRPELLWTLLARESARRERRSPKGHLRGSVREGARGLLGERAAGSCGGPEIQDLFEQSLVLPRARSYGGSLLLRHELETLGVLVSRHPLEVFQPWLSRFDTVPAAALADHVGETVTVAGWFVTGKTVITRKNEPMEFVSFEDTTALYETTFFPRVYDRFYHLLSDTKPYMVIGLVEEDFGVVSLTVEDVIPFGRAGGTAGQSGQAKRSSDQYISRGACPRNSAPGGCSEMSRCKAHDNGDPSEGWGVRPLGGQIPRNEA